MGHLGTIKCFILLRSTLEELRLEAAFLKKQVIGINSLRRCYQLGGDNLDHPNIAAATHQIGLIYEEKSTFDEGEKCFKQRLPMQSRIQVENADNSDIAASLHKMGTISLLKGLFDEAEKCYKQSCEIKKENDWTRRRPSRYS